MVTHRDRLVILSFMTSPYQNATPNGESSLITGTAGGGALTEEYHGGGTTYDADAHLIEKFGTIDDDEEEFFEHHEPVVTTVAAEIPEERHPVTYQSTPVVESTPGGRRGGRNRGNHRSSTRRVNNDPENNSYRARKQKGSSSNTRRGENLDDVDVNLELRPEKGVPFERLNNYDGTVFEVSRNGRKQLIRPTRQPEFTSRRTKDSSIHIVRPEKLPDGYLPSTPMTANSKIIEIKANTAKNASRRAKRSSRHPNNVVIEPSALIGAIPLNVTIAEDGGGPIVTFLQKLFGMQLGKESSDPQKWISLPSLEFLNLAIAIMIWSVRYPAVFWGTSKSFAIIFSFQMLANGCTILLDFVGCSVLYKIEIMEPPPPLKTPGLLLNDTVTVSLFTLSTILIMSSSLVLYLYGHGKLATKMRERKVISTKNGDTWSYFAHCASLCFVLALSVVKAPILHDLSATYKGSLDRVVLVSALASVVHLFLWVMLWLMLTAKRRWAFKLPPLEHIAGAKGATEPLLMASHRGGSVMAGAPGQSLLATSGGGNCGANGGEETIYWPKLTPSSPKLKVTFNEVPSTSPPQNVGGEHDGKRNKARGATVCVPPLTGEADDGDYATLRGPTGDLLHLSDLTAQDIVDDNTSEEGKLLESVRDDSVTYASTRDLEPPVEQMVSPLAPVTVTVHTNEAHITSSSTPRCLRRADSGVPNEALTPRSDTTSTEESASPPDRAPSETSSGVHSGEERDLSEVTIRPRPGSAKVATKPIPPAIEEEPFSRSTNMRMSSFAADGLRTSSATLPLTRAISEPPMMEYPHCSTMPLPVGCHQQIQNLRQHSITPNSQSKTQLMHTTLPNGIRQFTKQNQFLMRRLPHVRTAESPYGILGLGSGHHTFSKLLHEPLTVMPIPEDRDSANYSIISEQDIYITH
uniref:Protein tincar n=1 Tax=Lutzomyia longipalpis TaxID=7200 RepID=A0A1B0CRX7_LUTLO